MDNFNNNEIQHDPVTGQPINYPMNFDPMTGERLNNGQPVNQPMNFDPMTGERLTNNEPINYNQPVNFNPEAGQQFNNQSVNPPQPPIPDDENPACKRLCNISLGLLIAGLLSSGSNIFMNLWGNAAYIIESIGGFLFHAGLVVMIIARVKYPKSTYAKTLMWVYIALYIITVVLIIIAIVACIWIFESCMGDLSACGNMG